MKIVLNKSIKGKILDIGGGGEGVIGRLYGKQVLAVDNRQEELDEAPGGFEKMLMDARKLDFSDEFFDAVTAFYSFMFMDNETREKAALEMARVLKKGGKICIWDTEIPSSEEEPFCVDLEIVLPEENIKTTFGIAGFDIEQNSENIKNFFEKTGLICKEEKKTENNFYFEFVK